MIDTVSTFGDFAGTYKWVGGVLAPNDCIYGIPYDATQVLKIDPATDTTSMFGGLTGTPMISQPQVGILGMGAIQKKPVVIDDAIAIRPIMVLALTFDHRIIDGATGFQFIEHVRNSLENFKLP